MIFAIILQSYVLSICLCQTAGNVILANTGLFYFIKHASVQSSGCNLIFTGHDFSVLISHLKIQCKDYLGS